MKEDLKKKRFYKAYGKHILLIEIALIFTLTFSFVVQIFFPPSIVLFTFVAWFIGMPISFLIHLLIFYRISKMELYPYEILRLGRFRFYFSTSIYFSFFLLFTLLYLISSFLTEIPSETLVIVEPILVYVLLVVFPMVIIAVLLNVTSITDRKKARLSFKTVLDAMELIRKEKKTKEKMKLIRKYVKWFREGLRSYNSHIYQSYPTHLEIVDIEQYHRSVCSAVLMGNQTEIENTIEQIGFALNCIGRRKKEDLRHFLIALKNMKSGKGKKEYALFELNEMIRILPFFERVKERLKSPIVTLFIGIIAIVLQVLRLIWK